MVIDEKVAGLVPCGDREVSSADRDNDMVEPLPDTLILVLVLTFINAPFMPPLAPATDRLDEPFINDDDNDGNDDDMDGILVELVVDDADNVSGVDGVNNDGVPTRGLNG